MSAPVKKCEVTPLEALRRLVAVAKWPDAHWFSSEGDWNEYQGELGVAEMVLRDAAAHVVPVAAQPALEDIQRFSLQQYRDSDESMYSHIGEDSSGDYVLLSDVIKALAVPQAAQPVVQQEPIYLISFPDDPRGIWRIASEEAYHVTSAGRRRILYAAPSLEAQPAGGVERDAARYHWLRSIGKEQLNVMAHYAGVELDKSIDKAIAMAQGEKHEGL